MASVDAGKEMVHCSIPDDQRQHRRLTMALPTVPRSCDGGREVRSGDQGGTPASPGVQRSMLGTSTPASTSSAATASSPCDPGNFRATLDLSFGKFWATSDEAESDEDDEGMHATPTKEEFIDVAVRARFSVQDLI
jgi:hypothetical protein